MPNEGYLLRIFQLLLLYATPMFVFISEFLLAKQYKTKVKDGFFKQKLLTLGIPYIIINLGLAYVYGHPKNFEDYMDSVVFMMFHGGTLTYFIVIIFQFYLLHIVFAKHLVKLNPIKLVIYSLIITTLFWAMRNFCTRTRINLFELVVAKRRLDDIYWMVELLPIRFLYGLSL